MNYIEKNIAEFEIMNIPTWHKAGYTGKGVTVCVLDTDLGTDKMEHADKVINVIKEIAPDVTIKHFKFINASLAEKRKAINWIIENKPDIVNCSFVSRSNYISYFNSLKELDIPVVCAVGNDAYDNQILYPASAPWTIAIGAYEEQDKEVEKYSNKGNEIDAVAFTDIAIKGFNGVIRTIGGTSISSPTTSGSLSLYAQLLKESSLYLAREKARAFIKGNCIDLESEGHDIISGHGLFILPKELPRKEELDMAERINSLSELHPYARILAEIFEEKAKQQGIDVYFIETYRSHERQQELFNQGRTTPGGIVTNARPGRSTHQWRCAFDAAPLIDGKIPWDRHDLFDKLGEIGESIGLTWGGNFESIVDKPHYQWTGGLTIDELEAGQVPANPIADVSPWAQKSWVKALIKKVNDGIGPQNNITEEQLMVFFDRLGLLD